MTLQDTTVQVEAAEAGSGQPHADLIKADILEVATAEFAAKGLSGARVDEIADRTRTSKRMIYYHFGSKEGLFRAVLAHCYGRIRAIESTLDLGARAPLDALAHLVRFTFDYQLANADFIRLVMVENIHRAEHIAEMPELHDLNLRVIESLRDLCARGAAEGVMRPDVDARTCTCRSARSASSTSPTSTPSRRSSTWTWSRRRPRRRGGPRSPT